MDNRYSNFVRPAPAESSTIVQPSLNGIEVRRIYLEEIKRVGDPYYSKRVNTKSVNRIQHVKPCRNMENVPKKDLFICVQNNDVKSLINKLDACPDMINITDDYGWSLLMIACQASSVDAVKELLKRGIDTNVRDKAGNSARSLVIKSRNYILADILLNCKPNEQETVHYSPGDKVRKTKANLSFHCEMCDKEFPNKEKHLSSTVHNISASKDKKIPTNYVIPASNKGYQLMLKVGWDRESGLGPDGSGKKYPLKTVQKLDRKGLGLEKRKRGLEEEKQKPVKHVNRKLLDAKCKNSRNIEINFRRQFY